MTTTYPGAIDAFSTKVDGTDFVMAAHVNNIQDGLMAAQTAIGAEGNQGLCEGRLTLTTGVPVTTADVTAATTLYFTPYNGNRIALHDGTGWITRTFTQLSVSLAGLTANTNYDIFIYYDAGAMSLYTPVSTFAWSSGSARAVALALQDGIYVSSSSSFLRYLGTIRTTGTTGQTEDSVLARYVWNYYNRRTINMVVSNATSHTYNSATIRAFNNGALFTSGMAYVVGLVDEAIMATLSGQLTWASGDSNMSFGIGIVSTTNIITALLASVGTTRTNWAMTPVLPALGYNELWANESTTAAGTAPTFGTARLLATLRA